MAHMASFQRLLLGLAFASVLSAQDFRATLTGAITDASGAAVPAAMVTVKNVSTNETNTTRSNESGNFTLGYLRPGDYTVSVEAQGFKRLERSNVNLVVGQTANLSVQLDIGSTADQVTVTGEAPLLEATKADRGIVLDSRKLENFPINGRNPLMMAAFVPGVSFRGGSIRAFDNGSIAHWNINGSPALSTEFLLDGAPNNSQQAVTTSLLSPPWTPYRNSAYRQTPMTHNTARRAAAWSA